MNPIIEQLKQYGMVPLLVLEDAKVARLFTKALCEKGLPLVEITY